VFLKVGGTPPPLGGDSDEQGGDWGAKKHQGGENAQLLIDH